MIQAPSASIEANLESSLQCEGSLTARFYMLRYLQIFIGYDSPALHSNVSDTVYSVYILEGLRHIGLHLLVYF